MLNRTQAQIVLFILLVGLDQLTKLRIQKPDFQPFFIIDGLFSIIGTLNAGVVSMFVDQPTAPVHPEDGVYSGLCPRCFEVITV